MSESNNPVSLRKLEFFSPEHLLAAIVDSSDDAIVSKDLNGIITSWNRGAEKIFGYTAAEAIGQPVLMIIPPDRHDEELGILERLRRGERVERFDTVRVRKDGSLVDVSLTISPLQNAEGRVVGASKIARDITQQRRSSDELLAAKAEAERQSRMKDEFLATLSHELRTPLQSVVGWTQLLREGPASEAEWQQGLDIIERNAQAQTRIIEDLLDMSRILAGKVRLDVQRVQLDTIMDAAIESVRPAADARGVHLQSAIDRLSQTMYGDPARLQQIFWNLLSNAIKFTPRNGQVSVTLARVGSHLEVSVRDTGMGISREFLPYVFDRFRQADATTTRKHGGLGLGLAIVKHLTELHGGTVKAESAGEMQGSTFTIMLPISPVHLESQDEPRVHPDVAPSEPVHLPTVRLNRISVLVVDDEDDARRLISKILERSGATVRTAASAREALDLLQQAAPDILISDIGMPGEDGYSLIRTIRSLPAAEGGRVPAIALSAYTRKEDRVRAFREGFQVHLAKPAEPGELLAVVMSLAAQFAIPR